MKIFATAAFLSAFGSAATGASLTIPFNEQSLITEIQYDWMDFGIHQGAGNPFTAGLPVVNLAVAETDSSTYGVRIGSGIQTSFLGDLVELVPPVLGGPPLFGEGYADSNGDSFSYSTRIGTGIDDGSVVRFDDWEFTIEPGNLESIGQPVRVRVSANILGHLSVESDLNQFTESSSFAQWEVSADGITVIAGNKIVLLGESEISESNFVEFNSTIGSSFPFRADARVTGSGDISAQPSLTMEVDGAIDALLIGISVFVPACDADLNGDGTVDTADLGALIAVFGTDNPAADINGDSIVDTADLGSMIASFGHGCADNAD